MKNTKQSYSNTDRSVTSYSSVTSPQCYVENFPRSIRKQAVREAATIYPRPCNWPLTLKVVSESRVTWATSLPILVFLGLSVLDLGPMYATDRRQTDVRRASSLNAPTLRARV